MLKIVVSSDAESTVVLYSITCTEGLSVWETTKRYSEFDSLKHILEQRKYELPKDVPFPPKTASLLTALGFCAPMTQEELAARAEGLEAYFAAVSDISTTWDSDLVKDFFKEGEPTTVLPPPKPEIPAAIASAAPAAVEKAEAAGAAVGEAAQGATDAALEAVPSKRPSMMDKLRNSMRGSFAFRGNKKEGETNAAKTADAAAVEETATAATSPAEAPSSSTPVTAE